MKNPFRRKLTMRQIVLLLICLEICRRLADINDREGILE